MMPIFGGEEWQAYFSPLGSPCFHHLTVGEMEVSLTGLLFLPPSENFAASTSRPSGKMVYLCTEKSACSGHWPWESCHGFCFPELPKSTGTLSSHSLLLKPLLFGFVFYQLQKSEWNLSLLFLPVLKAWLGSQLRATLPSCLCLDRGSGGWVALSPWWHRVVGIVSALSTLAVLHFFAWPLLSLVSLQVHNIQSNPYICWESCL